MEYRLAVRGSADDLTESVNTLIEQGWAPHGGVSHSSYRFTNERKGYEETAETWAQAMTHDGAVR